MQKEHIGPTDFVQTEQTEFSLSWHTQGLNPKGKERLPKKDLLSSYYLGSPDCLKLSEFHWGSKTRLKETLVIGFSV